MRTIGAVAGLLALAACNPAPAPGPRDLDTVADDKELEGKIVYMLANDRDIPELKARNIKVECVKGVVTLSGAVKSQAEKDRAGRIADIHGVHDVVNRLTVARGS